MLSLLSPKVLDTRIHNLIVCFFIFAQLCSSDLHSCHPSGGKCLTNDTDQHTESPDSAYIQRSFLPIQSRLRHFTFGNFSYCLLRRKERSLTKGWAGLVDGRSTKLLRRDFSQITDGQVQAVNPSAAVTPVQVQAVTPSAIVTPVLQITDDQVQAASTAPIAQITEGQVQAVTTKPPVSAVHQFTNGEIQAVTSVQIVTPVMQNTIDQFQTDVPTSHAKSTALVPHSPITPSSSISSSSNANPAITPSAAESKPGEKAGIGVGAVVGACGIGVLICFLVRLRGNGYGQHDGGGEQESCAEPQPQHDGLGVPGELACVEMETLPAMEKIHELPLAEDPPISCATHATSADRSLPYEMGTE